MTEVGPDDERVGRRSASQAFRLTIASNKRRRRRVEQSHCISQNLPGFRLAMDVIQFGRQLLTFKPIESDLAARVLRQRSLCTGPGDKSGDKL